MFCFKVFDALPVDTDGRFVRCKFKIEKDGTLHFKKLERSACIDRVAVRTSLGSFDLTLDYGWVNVERGDLLDVKWSGLG